jgi:hypothetical protein
MAYKTLTLIGMVLLTGGAPQAPTDMYCVYTWGNVLPGQSPRAPGDLDNRQREHQAIIPCKVTKETSE